MTPFQALRVRNTAAGGATDPNFANVVALLHFEGTDGGTTFTDVIGHTFSAIGSGPNTDTAQAKFGTASLDNANYGISSPTSTDFAMGSGDFTVECWARLTSISSPDANNAWIITKANSGEVPPWAIIIKATTGLRFLGSTDGATFGFDKSDGTAFSINTWYHIALTRSGNSWRGFQDGVQIGTTGTLSGTVNANSSALAIGNFDGGDNHTFSTQGWIDDVRVTKGVARYTGNFTPPTATFPDS